MALCQVVDVRALGVREAAENALVAKVPREQLALAIAAVLKHHAVVPRPLACLDDVPTVLYHVGRRHRDEHVLARVHRIERDASVEIRRHRDINDIDFMIVPAFGRAEICLTV